MTEQTQVTPEKAGLIVAQDPMQGLAMAVAGLATLLALPADQQAAMGSELTTQIREFAKVVTLFETITHVQERAQAALDRATQAQAMGNLFAASEAAASAVDMAGQLQAWVDPDGPIFQQAASIKLAGWAIRDQARWHLAQAPF